MNVPLVVTDSNKFDYITDEILVAEPTVEDLIEKINQAVTRRVHTHDYVVNNWSHIQYADALETGLKSIL